MVSSGAKHARESETRIPMHEAGPRTTLVPMVLIALAACEPIYVLPGGALSGPEHAVPEDWTFANDVEVVQFEARPSDPYSVNLWGVGLGPYYYVSSSSGADWVAMATEEPIVRLRIDGRIYLLSASSVTDPAELERVTAAYVAKYDVNPEEDFPPNVAVFRLAAR